MVFTAFLVRKLTKISKNPSIFRRWGKKSLRLQHGYLMGLILKNYYHFGPSNISVWLRPCGRRTVKNFQTVNFLLAPPQLKSLGAAAPEERIPGFIENAYIANLTIK